MEHDQITKISPVKTKIFEGLNCHIKYRIKSSVKIISLFLSLSIRSDAMAHQVAPMTNNLAKKIDKRFVLPSSLSVPRP